jgi:protein-tyrosine phosphatase
VDGPWAGRLALATRPRGGEWLSDEIHGWHEAGINAIFSLLTPEENAAFDILTEPAEARNRGMAFLSHPIHDRNVPESESTFQELLVRLEAELGAGRNVVLHCQQGVGRTGLVAACLLLTKGFGPEAAMQMLSAARGRVIPDTETQRQWVDNYAERLRSKECGDEIAS